LFRIIQAFDMWSGNTYTVLRGHYECVNSCWFNQQDQVCSCSRGGGPFSFPILFLSVVHQLLVFMLVGPTCTVSN